MLRSTKSVNLATSKLAYSNMGLLMKLECIMERVKKKGKGYMEVSY